MSGAKQRVSERTSSGMQAASRNLDHINLSGAEPVEASAHDEMVRYTKITASGTRPPGLYDRGLSTQTIATFLTDYARYRKEIEFDKDMEGSDTKRRLAGIGELMSMAQRRSISARFFSAREALSDSEFKEGLERAAGIPSRDCICVRDLERDIAAALIFDKSLSIEDLVTSIAETIEEYMEAKNYLDIFVPDGTWRAGPGEIFVAAMIAALEPEGFRDAVRTRAKFEHTEHDPYRVLEIMDDSKVKYVNAERVRTVMESSEARSDTSEGEASSTRNRSAERRSRDGSPRRAGLNSVQIAKAAGSGVTCWYCGGNHKKRRCPKLLSTDRYQV